MRVHDTRAHTACTERANCPGPGAMRARRRAAAGVRLTPTLQEHSWRLHSRGPRRRGARLLAGVHGHEQPAPVEHDIERVRRGPRGHANELAGLGGALSPKLEHLRTRQTYPARALHRRTGHACRDVRLVLHALRGHKMRTYPVACLSRPSGTQARLELRTTQHALPSDSGAHALLVPSTARCQGARQAARQAARRPCTARAQAISGRMRRPPHWSRW